MKCVLCGHTSTAPGLTTVPLERGDYLLVVRHVPAEVCENCGEAYLDEKTTSQLLREAEDAAQAAKAAGVKVEVRAFAA